MECAILKAEGKSQRAVITHDASESLCLNDLHTVTQQWSEMYSPLLEKRR